MATHRQESPPRTGQFGTTPSNKKRKRAHRFSDEDWESHKNEILELYKTLSKEEVVREMNDKGFFINERQLGYRLRDKWGVEKYHTGNNADESPSKKRTKYTRKQSNKRPVGPSTSPSSAPSKSISPTIPCRRVPSRYLPSLGDLESPRSASDGVSLSQIRILADFFLSIEDDKRAFSLYEHVYKQEYSKYQGADESTWAPHIRNVIALARSADTATTMEVARSLIQETLSEHREVTFVLQAFDAYMYGRSLDPTNKPQARMQASKAIETLQKPLNVASQLLKLGTQIDVLTMFIIRWVLNVYHHQSEEDNNGEGENATIKSKQIYHNIKRAENKTDVVSFQTTLPGLRDIHAGRQPTTPVLRRCLIWIQNQLEREHIKVPSMLQDVSCSPSQERWRDSFELFLSTWLRWWDLKQDGEDDGWSGDCEEHLGISASELLSVLLLVALDSDVTGFHYSSEDTQNPMAPLHPALTSHMFSSEDDIETETLTRPVSPEVEARRSQLLLRAKWGVETLIMESGCDEANIWKKFLFKFFRHNWILNLKAEDQNFKENMLWVIHAWIKVERSELVVDVEPAMSCEFETSDEDADTELSDHREESVS